MRTITSHQINECNKAISILTDEPDKNDGNVSHYYECRIDPNKIGDAAYSVMRLEFQCGSPGQVGVNGITHEILLAILKDRLECFQNGPYACQENDNALGCIKSAIFWLERRIMIRDDSGVDGAQEL